MKNLIPTISTLFIILCSCQKQNEVNISETFYLEQAQSSMRILVEGNTASRTFIIVVHGGPGTSSFFYNTDYISKKVEDKYAVVYWDQRNSGISQGNNNGSHLTLDQMTQDLKSVIDLIYYQYGEQSKVVLLGHSYGGLLTTSFLTSEENQKSVDGWILVDGSHNYPLNNIKTRDMLLQYGTQEVDAGNNIGKWNEIMNYCSKLPDSMNIEQANQLNSYANEAETLFEQVKPFDMMEVIKENAIEDHWSITSTLFNHSYTQNATFNNVLAETQLSSELHKITIPTMLLFGKYDFICPSTLGQDIYDNINAQVKTFNISDKSGHSPMFQDEVWYCEQINFFVKNNL